MRPCQIRGYTLSCVYETYGFYILYFNSEENMTDSNVTIKSAASEINEIKDSTRFKRLPMFLKNKIQQSLNANPDCETNHKLLKAISLTLDSENKLNKILDELSKDMITAYNASDEDKTQLVYVFLLYFSNIQPKQTYPDDEVNIPSEYRIVTSGQHCFDIRELVKDAKIESAQLINPISNNPFFSLDQKRIFNMAYALGLEFNKESTQAPADKFAGFDASRYKVITRNGFIVDFSEHEISHAVQGAINSVYDNETSVEVKTEKTKYVTFSVLNNLKKKYPKGAFVHIETIQNIVENSLMEKQEFDVAKAYVIYRDKRNEERKKNEQTYEPMIRVALPNGQTQQLDIEGLKNFLINLAEGLEGIQIDQLVDEAYRGLYDKIPYNEVNDALVLVARTKIEINPEYSFLASRLLNHKLIEESISTLSIEQNDIQIKQANFDYSHIFSQYISKGVEKELLSPALLDFDLAKIEQALVPARDKDLSYLAMQTLYDRYFIHHKGRRIELPQFYFMRVAMGVCINEKERKEEIAIDFYHKLSQLNYMVSSPTGFNSGTLRPQLSSCFLSTVGDSLTDIFQGISDNAQLSKFAGGLGNDWTNIRANGSFIKGTNGQSSGVIPFLNVANSVATAVNQGGKRDGAVCAYIEAWHGDVMDFLELRKNTGDDRRRTHDMNTAIWIPDLLMQRVFEKKQWTLFSPDTVPGLHDSYGTKFKELYEKYEAMAEEGTIQARQIDALTLWRKVLSMLFETGHPWITFKDPCNIRSPQQHAGVVHSSNLCTEITLNTSADEVAVCNLGSINLAKHINPETNTLDLDKLKSTITLAVRLLDNVIDCNHYPIEATRRSNMRHRPVGLGMMGLQDALNMMQVPIESDEAVKFSDNTMEQISYFAIDASIELARERGSYPSYEGSLWSKNILPIDSLKMLADTRGDYIDVDHSSQLDWTPVREKLSHYGIRNSNLLAIAPTATISNICNVSQSIEPTYLNLSVKSNMSGEFTVVNPGLIKELKKVNLWNEDMLNKLKMSDGSIQQVAEIPQALKDQFKTAFEIDPEWLIKAASRRQKWIDQAQSLNLYMAKPSGRKLDLLYKSAWINGLKTTYYLRSLGATSTEKSTIEDGRLNAVKRQPQQCAIDDPGCEACQ